MKTVMKDMLLSVLAGLVLPGILLNTAVWALENRTGAEQEIILEETAVTDGSRTLSVRLSQGALVQWELEEYLVGVVLAEMPATFEEEALKAQAVAARTYTWKACTTGSKHGDGSVCTDPDCCQAYLSPEAYQEKNGRQESLDKVLRAVNSTAGEVITYEGELIEAPYFSCSGGRTEAAREVWSAELPYLQAVDSPGEEAAAWFTDKVVYSPEEFQDKLGLSLEGGPESWFGSVEYTHGGGVAAMEIGKESYAGTYLRSKLDLRSTAFTISVGEDITITTRGYGHRVGMSQYGADAMAVTGSGYAEILAHYYPGTQISNIDALS